LVQDQVFFITTEVHWTQAERSVVLMLKNEESYNGLSILAHISQSSRLVSDEFASNFENVRVVLESRRTMELSANIISAFQSAQVIIESSCWIEYHCITQVFVFAVFLSTVHSIEFIYARGVSAFWVSVMVQDWIN
jgi:hypothetical protein